MNFGMDGGMDSVVLIRHARPIARPGTHPALWRLDAGATAAAAALAAELPAGLGELVWSSPEAKALGTAEALTAALPGRRLLRVEPDLREAGRPGTWSHAYGDEAAAYLRRGERAGWEDASAVVERTSRVIRLAAAAAAGPVALVTHGLVIALVAEALVGVPADDFWRELAYPDAWLLRGGELVRLPLDPVVNLVRR